MPANQAPMEGCAQAAKGWEDEEGAGEVATESSPGTVLIPEMMGMASFEQYAAHKKEKERVCQRARRVEGVCVCARARARACAQVGTSARALRTPAHARAHIHACMRECAQGPV